MKVRSILFTAFWTVAMASTRDFQRHNDLQRPLRAFPTLLRLGDPCRSSLECLHHLHHSHCDAQKKVCTCQPHHFQLNNTFCLPASLLGYSCAVDGQCQLKVVNSQCSEDKLCECQANFLPLRKDKCLPPAPVGKYCLNTEQCRLWDRNSRCRYIVPRIYGKCECEVAPDENGKCLPGLGGVCSADVECQRVTPLSVCREDTCQCLHGRKGDTCIDDVSGAPSSVRPVSLGKVCVSHSQCQARDPHTRCVEGRCECVLDTPSCSSGHTRCLNDTFQCTSGQCISWYFVCDGERNCLDGTDEENCTPFACPAESFQCNDGTCLSRSSVCNGRWECPDGSDEARCYTGIPCDAHSFRCASGQCVPAYAFCNAVVDCLDGSDEDFAACERGEGCPEESFRCGNGRCRSSAILCSGLDGCGDNTDEDRCNVCRCEAPE